MCACAKRLVVIYAVSAFSELGMGSTVVAVRPRHSFIHSSPEEEEEEEDHNRAPDSFHPTREERAQEKGDKATSSD